MAFETELPVWWWFVMPLWPVWVVGLWAMWKMFRDGRDAKTMERATNWPEVQGVILSNNVGWAHVAVRYEYWLFAERHEGLYKINLTPVPVGAGAGTGAARSARALGDEAKRYQADFPVGAKVIVRYNRSNPQDSVLFCIGEIKPASPNDPKIEPHFTTLE